jgi:hypothetical protein
MHIFSGSQVRALEGLRTNLKQITSSGITDFNEIFREFWKTEGIYGFSDLQVKNMLATL